MLSMSLLGITSAKDLYVPTQVVPSPIETSGCMVDYESCVPADAVGNQLYFVVRGPESEVLYAFDSSEKQARQLMAFNHPVCDIKFIDEHQFYIQSSDLFLYDLRDLKNPIQGKLPKGYVSACEDDMLLLDRDSNKLFFINTRGDIMSTTIGKITPVTHLTSEYEYNELLKTDGNYIYFIDKYYDLLSLDPKTNKTQMTLKNEDDHLALFINRSSNLLYLATTIPKVCLLNIYNLKNKSLKTIKMELCPSVIKETPHQELLVAGRFGGFLVLDAQGKVLQRVKEQKVLISSIEFLQDGTLCVVREDGSLQLYRRNE